MNTTLVMGPVLFNWTPEDWRDFHFRMADEADVDVVCVGEVVCSKRAPFFEPYMADVIERLLAADKQVILFTCHPSHADLLGGNRINLDPLGIS